MKWKSFRSGRWFGARGLAYWQ